VPLLSFELLVRGMVGVRARGQGRVNAQRTLEAEAAPLTLAVGADAAD
jgi:hypothetical protein